MPELPEVETVRRGLAPVMVGASFTTVEQRRADLRFPFPDNFAARLEGRRVEALGRRAKYLLADLDDAQVLVMHLGMSGSFRIEKAGDLASPPPGKNAAHDHVVFGLSTGTRIIYNDPRRFGFMHLIARQDLAGHPLFRNVGIEPLGNELEGALLARLFAGKTTPLKTALLDQTLIAGLGNIYVCEALHRAGLSPRRAAGTLAGKKGQPTERAHRLSEIIRAVLEEAIEAGGSSLRDHRQADGALGYFQHRFRVYDREAEPCPREGCGGTIKRIVQAGRSTFFCAKCQR
ncbi:bifunctional DNA-formamidopyrimidine glycosylase/DNA-(apurinic or apyrimidinic site) lyase [Beijerinckia indica]|uniref:Formamidopyrimidine-DNA glycosylase n=1 Tax=Beijerinckia indica subsp. indica (strain ATCC 9039 / DSM 1715 / NCIMB 8712) TaxID=395963 RepID=FPG_BEII9|nr:bifunctional DNA-formamidopyrimidine glycosylase/DNA-(apurinic or apyrimidinic site) lyase [Beijerinckia indica]B2IE81.1 RecName: Full=Formamidopyrimidine-DNA glycosylase; Short=Fapy-DNA glycosylase; AltName: Full=DNA-(apurinic or apyrimidinic site) lyase MutM; Short=AP lyase MutM [Beijerinckia indica subsp. indica ATCC 9039]ACB94105.1 formamidopyrimidine-DNA glycosylase [Beijerinckia indica subsp. indica ATCC 9039]